MGMSIAAAQMLFDAEPGWLNTASYGLPPRPAWDALQQSLREWQTATGEWEEWASSVETSRGLWGQMVGVSPADVAVGATVSELLGSVAASVPDDSRVLAVEGDFTSLLFPFLAQAGRGVTVTLVPVGELANAVTPEFDVVAFGLVQSAGGEVAEYEAIVSRTRDCGAMIVVDATQACGWVPFDASLADVVVAGAYTWLLAPRGTVFMFIRPEVRDRVVPHAAGWFAGADVHSSYFGTPLRIAENARRLDRSPAWFSWVGTAPALELVLDVGVDAINNHNVSLSNQFLSALGKEPSNSAIVCVAVRDAASAQDRLAAAGVRASIRAGRVRASFHLYSTQDDVDLAVRALRPLM